MTTNEGKKQPAVKPSLQEKLNVYNNLISWLKCPPAVNGVAPLALTDSKQLDCLIAEIIDDLKSENISNNEPISCTALQLLTLSVHNPTVTAKLGEERSVAVVKCLCDVVNETKDKEICTKVFRCIQVQTLNTEVLATQLPTVLSAINVGQCTKNFQSTSVEYAALGAIIRLLQQVGTEMSKYTVNWAPLVYPLILHRNVNIRDRAMVAMETGLPAMMSQQTEVAACLASDLKTLLIKDLEALQGIEGLEVHAMAAWRIYVRLLGSMLHRGSLCNALLPAVERCFKHSNTEVKMAAFAGWKELIDNFALNEDIISDTKRVKLIMLVFLSDIIRIESVAVEKFHAWWHYVCRLGDRAVHLFEQVVIPLIQFSIEGTVTPLNSGSNTSTAAATGGKRGFKSPSPMMSNRTVGSPVSPVQPKRVYKQVQILGCQALTMIVTRSLSSSSERFKQLTFNIERLSTDSLCRAATFCKYSSFLMDAARQCFTTLDSADHDEMLLSLWRALVLQVGCVLELTEPTLDRINTFGSLLALLQELTASCNITPTNILTMLSDVVDNLPSKVLASHHYSLSDVMQSCPCLVLIQVLFSSRVVVVATDERFRHLLDVLLTTVLVNVPSVLVFYEKTVELLGKTESHIDCRDTVVTLWSAIASRLQEHINKTHEVNQGDNLQHNFSCMYAVLMFPIMHLFNDNVSQVSMESVMKLWEEVYVNFARLSALVDNVDANIGCEQLAARMLTYISDKQPTDVVFWANVGQILTLFLGSTFDFSSVSNTSSLFAFSINSPTKVIQRHRKPLSNLHSVVHVVARFSRQLDKLYTQQSSAEDSSLSPCLQSCVTVWSRLFNAKLSAAILSAMLGVANDALTIVFTLSARHWKSLNKTMHSKLDKLWTDVSASLQSSSSSFDSEFLQQLNPLLTCLLKFPRQSVVMTTIKFWNNTFAKCPTLTCPSTLWCALAELKQKKSSVVLLLPSWQPLIGDISDCCHTESSQLTQIETIADSCELPNVVGVPSPRKSVGSFLQRLSTCESPGKQAPPMQQQSPACSVIGSPAPGVNRRRSSGADSPFARPTSARKLTQTLRSMADLSTQDFVPIATTKKRNVLTEHQREMRSRKSDLPAMYNNLDNSSQASLDVFTQQHNTDSTQTLFDVKRDHPVTSAQSAAMETSSSPVVPVGPVFTPLTPAVDTVPCDSVSVTPAAVELMEEVVDVAMEVGVVNKRRVEAMSESSCSKQPSTSVATEPTRECGAATEPTRECGAATEPTRECGAATEPTRECGAATEPTRECGAATEPTRECGVATESESLSPVVSATSRDNEKLNVDVDTIVGPENVMNTSIDAATDTVNTNNAAETSSDNRIQQVAVINMAGDDQTDNNVAPETDINVATETDSNVATETDINVATETDSNVATETDINVATETDSNVATETDSDSQWLVEDSCKDVKSCVVKLVQLPLCLIHHKPLDNNDNKLTTAAAAAAAPSAMTLRNSPQKPSTPVKSDSPATPSKDLPVKAVTPSKSSSTPVRMRATPNKTSPNKTTPNKTVILPVETPKTGTPKRQQNLLEMFSNCGRVTRRSQGAVVGGLSSQPVGSSLQEKVETAVTSNSEPVTTATVQERFNHNVEMKTPCDDRLILLSPVLVEDSQQAPDDLQPKPTIDTASVGGDVMSMSVDETPPESLNNSLDVFSSQSDAANVRAAAADKTVSVKPSASDAVDLPCDGDADDIVASSQDTEAGERRINICSVSVVDSTLNFSSDDDLPLSNISQHNKSVSDDDVPLSFLSSPAVSSSPVVPRRPRGRPRCRPVSPDSALHTTINKSIRRRSGLSPAVKNLRSRTDRRLSENLAKIDLKSSKVIEELVKDENVKILGVRKTAIATESLKVKETLCWVRRGGRSRRLNSKYVNKEMISSENLDHIMNDEDEAVLDWVPEVRDVTVESKYSVEVTATEQEQEHIDDAGQEVAMETVTVTNENEKEVEVTQVTGGANETGEELPVSAADDNVTALDAEIYLCKKDGRKTRNIDSTDDRIVSAVSGQVCTGEMEQVTGEKDAADTEQFGGDETIKASETRCQEMQNANGVATETAGNPGETVQVDTGLMSPGKDHWLSSISDADIVSKHLDFHVTMATEISATQNHEQCTDLATHSDTKTPTVDSPTVTDGLVEQVLLPFGKDIDSTELLDVVDHTLDAVSCGHTEECLPVNTNSMPEQPVVDILVSMSAVLDHPVVCTSPSKDHASHGLTSTLSVTSDQQVMDISPSKNGTVSGSKTDSPDSTMWKQPNIVTSSASHSPAMTGDGPPETPTSSSRRRFISRGSLMLERAKQLRTPTPAHNDTSSAAAAGGGSETDRPPTNSVFPRQFFSPSASPSASILRKRHLLHADTAGIESPSPPNKQRRVCFSDRVETHEIPCRKMRLRTLGAGHAPVGLEPESGEKSPSERSLTDGRPVNRQLELSGQSARGRGEVKGHVRSPGSGSRFTAINKQRFISVDQTTLTSGNVNTTATSTTVAMGTTATSAPAVPAELLPTTVAVPDDVDDEDVLQSSAGQLIQPLTLTLTPESQLDSIQPVYVSLMDCTEPVTTVLDQLTSATWVMSLKKYLLSMNVRTIGDLSSLTEQEIHHLPIAQPKVTNVRNVLQQVETQLNADNTRRPVEGAGTSAPPGGPIADDITTVAINNFAKALAEIRAVSQTLPADRRQQFIADIMSLCVFSSNH